MNRNLYTFFSFFILGMFLPELANAQEQASLATGAAYLCFYFAEAQLGLSGVLAVVGLGLVFSCQVGALSVILGDNWVSINCFVKLIFVIL